MNYFKIALALFFFSNSSCAQDDQSKAELENEILGSWYFESDPKSKVVFSNDGTVIQYNGDEEQLKSTYEITNTCDGEKLQKGTFFLKQKSEHGTSSCSYIEAINYNDNGIFSLMTKEQGKVVVLKRKES